MDWLLALITGLPGSTEKSLQAILDAMNKAKKDFPELEAQIDGAAQILLPLVAPYMTREGVIQALTQFSVIFTPEKWGPPNPGAGALQ